MSAVEPVKSSCVPAATALKELEQLPSAQHGHDDEEGDHRPASVPRDAECERDGGGGEPDPLRQIAVHQAVTRPNRRSRR